MAPVVGFGIVAALLFASPARAAATEREVVFDGGGGVRLSATLALPPGASERQRVPVVVLVAGSGPTDRNGNQPPLLWTGLLKQAADLLAGAGIASLRYDKRGVGRSGQIPKGAAALADFVAWDKFVGDVAAAHDAIRAQPEIDPNRVALLGHSEGGLLVIAAALSLQDASRPPAAVILVSTPGRRTDLVIREQLAAACKRLGVSEEGTARYLARNDEVLASVRADGVVPADLPPDLAPLYPRYAGRFLQSQFNFDPADAAGRLTMPVLVIQGRKDLQVSAERDAPALEAALKKRPGNAKCALVVLEGAGHNLKHVEKDGEHAFYGPVVPEFRQRLVEWLTEALLTTEPRGPAPHAGS